MLGNFHFLRPWLLLLLPLVASLWWMRHQQVDQLRGWRQLIAPQLLGALTVGKGSRSGLDGLSLLLAWIVATLSLAGPTWRPEPSPFADDPVPTVLVLRCAESMDRTDLLPTRIERAQLKIQEFADQRRGLPLGLVAYAGSSHLVLPPTRDTAVVAEMAANLSPEVMPTQGDDLLTALTLAQKHCGSQGGTIVVVADNYEAPQASQLEAALSKIDLPVIVWAVARNQSPELTALELFARQLDAELVPLSPDETDVTNVVRSVARAPRAVSAEAAGVRWAEAGWWLMPLVAILFLLHFRSQQPHSKSVLKR